MTLTISMFLGFTIIALDGHKLAQPMHPMQLSGLTATLTTFSKFLQHIFLSENTYVGHRLTQIFEALHLSQSTITSNFSILKHPYRYTVETWLTNNLKKPVFKLISGRRVCLLRSFLREKTLQKTYTLL